MKNNHTKPKIIKLTILCLLLSVQATAQYQIKKYAIVNGGGFSSSQNHQINGSVGQKEATVPSIGNGYQLSPGFWVANNNDLIFRNGFE